VPMTLKKIAEMNYYEFLNVSSRASQQEIERAYSFEKATYNFGSLAHYSLLSEEEVRLSREKVEEAYRVLSNPKKRKLYDARLFPDKSAQSETTYYRQSTQKLVIEDAGKDKTWWDKVKIFFSRRA